MNEARVMSADSLTLQDAIVWMTGLAQWLDEQEEPLRFKDDPDSYMSPHATAQVLRLLVQPAHGAA